MARIPRVMMVGAHPDDCDFYAGGLAALWRQAGFEVLFVSATNGDAGHHLMDRDELAARRALEAKAAGEVIGIDYPCLEHHDGELIVDLPTRRSIIKVIRDFVPDVVLTHRPGDYHADHRAASLLVQDATFLLTVPLLCPESPALREMPVVLHTHDWFTKPEPFQPTVVVDIDPVGEQKARMVHCHESQVYEWLPWLGGYEVPTGETERLAWCREHVAQRDTRVADRFREQLVAQYGPERGQAVRCAEALSLTEYGAELDERKRRELFPFL